MVKPILCFGSEIWCYEYADVIESVHNEFCRYFLGVNSSVNNVVALGECGRLPLCVTYITIALSIGVNCCVWVTIDIQRIVTKC